MKRLYDTIKPFMAIIFGALLLLVYLNYLDNENGYFLALGILGVIMASYFLAAGILTTVAGNKLPATFRKVLDIVSIDFFALFMFLQFLFYIINYHEIYGPTGWTIGIISMIAALGLAVLFLVAKLVNNGVVARIAFLFAAAFVLALLLDLVFGIRGNAAALGDISVVHLALYALFTGMLLSSLAPAEQQPQQPAPKEEPKPEAEPEEKAE